MKILNVLYNFYGDFDFIEEKYNEKYEGILINIKEEQGYKRCRLAKRTPKKEGIFYSFLEKRPKQQEHSLYQWGLRKWTYNRYHW